MFVWSYCCYSALGYLLLLWWKEEKHKAILFVSLRKRKSIWSTGKVQKGKMVSWVVWLLFLESFSLSCHSIKPICSFREALSEIWDELVDVTLYDSHDKENLALIARPELGCTFSKLRAWTLTQFEKCVFLDADTLVIQNIDDLLEREELSAAPDIGWPDCFNSGVFVFRPCIGTYDKLLLCAQKFGSFDGITLLDAELLLCYYISWKNRFSVNWVT